MYLHIKIFSKSKVSLNNFLLFIFKFDTYLKTIAIFPNKNKKKFLTVLKSPHVNKNAQEQFELNFFSKNITVWSTQPKLFMFIFKKIINTSFSDLSFKLYCTIDSNSQIVLPNILNSNVNKINFVDFKHTDPLYFNNILKQYLFLFDCYGEKICKT